MSANLTPVQRRILRELAQVDNGTILPYHDKALIVLRDKGYICWPDGSITLCITDAGRQALGEAE